ncbi:Hypothetical protein DPCES_1429 [Desulfitobacterium hafniense]|uniref:Uncharacterized protein n=1 Tax=Desulfitobacterium hafniense TaxID=49338 RepID=A0A098AXA1_DESHA|nr:hypothetical protein [Desulfitobacterium hafniense]CDX00747.1 Hypothetical protein DPCES_0860 [Desulfitobacterium hafniense]CDX01316.1 Hypothetical protein DPCES_1429 [Desulfitobacterium hafniense]
MKMKLYTVGKAGSTEIGTLYATCITKAAKQFIATLDKPAKYELDSREQASIRYTDNHNLMGNFVITQK